MRRATSRSAWLLVGAVAPAWVAGALTAEAAAKPQELIKLLSSRYQSDRDHGVTFTLQTLNVFNFPLRQRLCNEAIQANLPGNGCRNPGVIACKHDHVRHPSGA